MHRSPKHFTRRAGLLLWAGFTIAAALTLPRSGNAGEPTPEDLLRRYDQVMSPGTFDGLLVIGGWPGYVAAHRLFSERAVREAGVASIPVSALCEGGGPTSIVRLCFAKDGAVLDEAVARLARFRERLAEEIG